jgi:hypothetical protein
VREGVFLRVVLRERLGADAANARADSADADASAPLAEGRDGTTAAAGQSWAPFRASFWADAHAAQ